VATQNNQKILNRSISEAQGRSRSLISVLPESSSAVLVTISSKSVSICDLSHARLVDSN